MKGKREPFKGQGTIGRAVRVKGWPGIWKVRDVGGLNGGTIQVTREINKRTIILGVNRHWVKFVRHNYEAAR